MRHQGCPSMKDIYSFSVFSHCLSDIYNSKYLKFPFIYKGRPLTSAVHPLCCITLKNAGSMRFRWNEVNENRNSFFKLLNFDSCIVSLELIHSRTVFVVSAVNDTVEKHGDGLITVRRNLVPVITVADCMPIYIYDPVSGCFGVLHSGWRGTGIVLDALFAAKDFGAEVTNFCVVLGPHIQQCCYVVDKERGDYFLENFSPKCVITASDETVHLSLAQANIELLLDAGVPAENIAYAVDCTCCDNRLGSFRREAAWLPDTLSLSDKIKKFTAMAAFCAFFEK